MRIALVNDVMAAVEAMRRVVLGSENIRSRGWPGTERRRSTSAPVIRPTSSSWT